jgi:hypothetical protein
MTTLLLKRVSAKSRCSGQWKEDDYDVLGMAWLSDACLSPMLRLWGCRGYGA